MSKQTIFPHFANTLAPLKFIIIIRSINYEQATEKIKQKLNSLLHFPPARVFQSTFKIFQQRQRFLLYCNHKFAFFFDKYFEGVFRNIKIIFWRFIEIIGTMTSRRVAPDKT